MVEPQAPRLGLASVAHLVEEATAKGLDRDDFISLLNKFVPSRKWSRVLTCSQRVTGCEIELSKYSEMAQEVAVYASNLRKFIADFGMGDFFDSEPLIGARSWRVSTVGGSCRLPIP